MKKKLAVLLPAMNMGGAEKIAINFLNDLILEYDVSLILNKVEGPLLKDVPKEVKIIEDKLLSFKQIFKSDLKKFKIINIFKDLLYYFKVKLNIKKEKNYYYLIKRTPKLNLNFDYLIGYVANVSTQIFCLDRLNAQKKIAWIHGETTELYDTKFFGKIYDKFNYIATVSQKTKEHFLNRFPHLDSKTFVYYNPINKDEIINKSKENISFDKKDNLIITTVARLTWEKGCSLIPTIASNLKKSGLSFTWYLIGNGTEKDLISKKLEELNLLDSVILTGELSNPYPYMKNCDIYVQPSFEEGFSTTICEAGILGCVIVGTTCSGGIYEQLESGVSGEIVDANTTSLTNAILNLVNNKEKYNYIKQNITLVDFSHNKEINKLKNLL